MLDVIEAIDGPICLNVCLVYRPVLHRKARCPAHPVWVEAQHAMLDVLSNTTCRRHGRSRPLTAHAIASPLPNCPICNSRLECFNQIIETGVLHACGAEKYPRTRSG